MRFIVFNIAVAAALVYLFKGGELPAIDLQAGADRAKAGLDRLVAAKTDDDDGHGRDAIGDPKPAPRPQPAPGPRPGDSPTKAAPQATAEQMPVTVAARPEPAPVPAAHPGAVKVPPVPPAVAARRAEVLAEPAAPRRADAQVTLKDGTALMSAAERRRELNALAEEMDMLYLSKVGR